MPKLLISIAEKQQRALERNITRTRNGSVSGEIRKAITQHLAGPKQIEAAFLTLLKRKAPKDLPPLSTIQKKLKTTTLSIDRSLARLKASERRLAALDRIDTSAIGLLAFDAFGSADKAYAWLQRPNKALGQRTPFSLLTGASGFKRVETLLKRMTYAVPRHEGSSR